MTTPLESISVQAKDNLLVVDTSVLIKSSVNSNVLVDIVVGVVVDATPVPIAAPKRAFIALQLLVESIVIFPVASETTVIAPEPTMLIAFCKVVPFFIKFNHKFPFAVTACAVAPLAPINILWSNAEELIVKVPVVLLKLIDVLPPAANNKLLATVAL